MSGHLSRRAIDVATDALDLARQNDTATRAALAKMDEIVRTAINALHKQKIEPLEKSVSGLTDHVIALEQNPIAADVGRLAARLELFESMGFWARVRWALLGQKSQRPGGSRPL